MINGNYAIEADLKPATDALVLESGEDNPYANLVVTRPRRNDPRVAKLEKLLHSAEVKKFIEDKYRGRCSPPSKRSLDVQRLQAQRELGLPRGQLRVVPGEGADRSRRLATVCRCA